MVHENEEKTLVLSAMITSPSVFFICEKNHSISFLHQLHSVQFQS